MSEVTKSLKIEKPITTVYALYSDFPSFPSFMEGVESITPNGPDSYHWKAKVFGKGVEWDAVITENTKNKKISWKNTTGATNEGTVTFEEAGASATMLTVMMNVEPEGLLENLGDALGMLSRQVEGDLERFKKYAESTETYPPETRVAPQLVGSPA